MLLVSVTSCCLQSELKLSEFGTIFEMLLMVWGHLLFCFFFNLGILPHALLVLVDKLIYFKKFKLFWGL